MNIKLDLSSLSGETIFSDQQYHFYTTEGKLCVKDNKKYKSFVIGNFYISINSYITDIDDDVVLEEYYEFVVYTANYKFTANIKASEASKINWLQKHSGSRICFESGKTYFPQYISFLISRTKYNHVRNYLRSGWKQHENQWIYVHSLGAISKYQQNELIKSQNNGTFFHLNADEKSIFEWSMNAYILCKSPESIAPLWLYVQLGFFNSLFDYTNYPIRFTLAYLGTSNAKKTAITNILTNILIKPYDCKPVINFKASQGGNRKNTI